MTTIYICTPCYNSVKTIDRTITSVIFQSGNFNIHYHIQDGGSTDGTINVLESWQRRIANKEIPLHCLNLVFTFASEADSGMYDAIVKSFDKLAPDSHSWMGWINSDDILNPGIFALLAELDIQHNHNWVRWVGGAASAAYYNCLPVANGIRPLNSYVIRNGLCDGLHWDFVQQEGTFFRKSLWDQIDKVRDFSSFKYAGDWNLWRKFAGYAELFQADWPTGTFFRTEKQVSQVHREKYMREIDETVSRVDRLLALKNMTLSDSVRNVIGTSYGNGQIFFKKEELVSRRDSWIQRNFGLGHSENVRDHLSVTTQGDGHLLSLNTLWQKPAITELHAYNCIRENAFIPIGAAYIGFPWATLIDTLNLQADTSLPKQNLDFLVQSLACLESEVEKIKTASHRVVTVCQHIRLMDHIPMFHKVGVTDIFWSHAVKEIDDPGKLGGIRIHPFPLFPVQYKSGYEDCKSRDLLFSFIGAKGDSGYLSNSRKYIIDYLSSVPGSLVVSRDQWHYQREVYDNQIYNREENPENTVDAAKSIEFSSALMRSCFSLCPSGTGPNSIRLWESIGFGAIPVILADTYLPPGDPKLWNEAVVFCEETAEAIMALPAKLDQMAKDPDILSRKRKAMKQLWMLYGPDNFIYDIHRLFLELAQPAPQAIATPIHASMDDLLLLSGSIDKNSSPESLKFFMLSCTTRAMRDPQGFKKLIESNRIASEALALSFKMGNPKDVEMARRVFQHRNIDCIRL